MLSFRFLFSKYGKRPLLPAVEMSEPFFKASFWLETLGVPSSTTLLNTLYSIWMKGVRTMVDTYFSWSWGFWVCHSQSATPDCYRSDLNSFTVSMGFHLWGQWWKTNYWQRFETKPLCIAKCDRTFLGLWNATILTCSHRTCHPQFETSPRPLWVH